jgi:DNA-binding MarR family transcriptional regulator
LLIAPAESEIAAVDGDVARHRRQPVRQSDVCCENDGVAVCRVADGAPELSLVADSQASRIGWKRREQHASSDEACQGETRHRQAGLGEQVRRQPGRGVPKHDPMPDLSSKHALPHSICLNKTSPGPPPRRSHRWMLGVHFLLCRPLQWRCANACGTLDLLDSTLRLLPVNTNLGRLPMKTKDMLIGALLRVPAQAIQRRLINELNAAGFEELRLPHMAVLQFPGPDKVRPNTLAERAGMSKQAINQLLRSLENSGYITRSNVPGSGNARLILSTKRGHAAYAKMIDILGDIEREWSAELGPKRFAELKALLFLVWDSRLTR